MMHNLAYKKLLNQYNNLKLDYNTLLSKYKQDAKDKQEELERKEKERKEYLNDLLDRVSGHMYANYEFEIKMCGRIRMWGTVNHLLPYIDKLRNNKPVPKQYQEVLYLPDIQSMLKEIMEEKTLVDVFSQEDVEKFMKLANYYCTFTAGQN